MAFRLQGSRKPKLGLRYHSDDLGSQYASQENRKYLSAMKMEQGMADKCNYWEGLPLEYNSPTKRFLNTDS